jgi:hypothetical protein
VSFSALAYVRRADALERVADIVRRLGELVPGEELPAHAAAELGRGSEFARVLISEVNGDQLTIVAAWERDDDDRGGGELLTRLRAAPVGLPYPLLEREVVRDRGARLVKVGTLRGAHAWAELLDRSCSPVAALVADPETIGLVHADDGERELDQLDREVITRFAAASPGCWSGRYSVTPSSFIGPSCQRLRSGWRVRSVGLTTSTADRRPKRWAGRSHRCLSR